MRKVGLLVAGVAALGMALGQANVIKIASQSPLSGPQAALGEQIKLGAELALETYPLALPKAEREWRLRAWAEEVLDYLHLSPYRHAPAGLLPYGLQKRVEVARALAGKPKLLLLDEPMAGLALEEKQDLARFLLDAREEWGVTLLWVEHDLRAVLELSDRVLVLSYGEVLYYGPPSGVRQDPRVVEAYLGQG